MPKGVPLKTSALDHALKSAGSFESSVCYVFRERERDDVGIFTCPVRTNDCSVKGNYSYTVTKLIPQFDYSNRI